ncbi:MAG: RDD family protein [bacterium]
MSETTIKSPFEVFESESIGFEISKKRFRIMAFIIDFYIYCMIGFILGFFFGTPLEDEVGFNLNGSPALAMMLIGLFLWPISEAIWGQTVGKRILKLKVLTDNFNSIGFGRAFGRFLFGFMDYIFLIGIIVAVVNTKNKRIGDLVANTIVVRTKKPTKL